jgi:flavin-binding protein dodecin
VYKTFELTGSSGQGVDDAIRIAVVKPSEAVRHIDWFEGRLDRAVAHTQVTVKVGFGLK